MSETRTAETKALHRLKNWFGDIRTTTDAHPFGDLVGELNGKEVRFEVKSLGSIRIEALLGVLARMVLVSQKWVTNSVPVIVLVAPRFGAKSLLAAQQFMAEYAPGVGWGAIDEHGTIRLSIPPLGLEVDERSRRVTTVQPPARRRIFSDLNRWLMKRLLLHPSDSPRTAAELAIHAEVSRSKAYAFVRDFSKLRYIEPTLQLRDVQSLLSDWLHEDRMAPAPRVFARGLYGPLSPSSMSGPQHPLGGFGACEHHGLLHTPYELPEIHVRNADSFLWDRNAGSCERRDAEVALIVSPFPESVFRSAADGVVDPWQAALDVAGDPARGPEQAEHVMQHLLALAK